MGRVSDILHRKIKENAECGIRQYSTGLPKVQSFVDGVRQHNMVTIGGRSGSGKTSFVLNNYVYKPLMQCIKEGRDDLEIIIFCLELADYLTLSKLVTCYIFDKYGYQIGMRDMLSFSEKLGPVAMKYIDEAWSVIEEMEKHIIFKNVRFDSNELIHVISQYYEKKGHFDENEKWIPDNPDLITLGIIDHIGEVAVSPGKTKKQEIDDIADVCKKTRNVFGTSWCILQQINRSVANVGRRDRYPGLELDDFKDSGSVAEKSDSVIGLYYPFGMKDYSFGGYNVKELRQVLKVAQILKCRWGASDAAVGLAYYGKACWFSEIPKSDEIKDYNMYKTASWVREQAQIETGLDEI